MQWCRAQRCWNKYGIWEQFNQRAVFPFKDSFIWKNFGYPKRWVFQQENYKNYDEIGCLACHHNVYSKKTKQNKKLILKQIYCIGNALTHFIYITASLLKGPLNFTALFLIDALDKCLFRKILFNLKNVCRSSLQAPYDNL